MTEAGDQTVFAAIAKYVGGKVLTAILVVAAGLVGYYFYRNPETLEDLWRTTKVALVWIGIAAALPWALFFVPAWVGRADSNAAAGVMLLGYLVIDVIVALWLANWHISGTLTWAVVVLGFMAAAVYNFLVCDFLAEHAEAEL